MLSLQIGIPNSIIRDITPISLINNLFSGSQCDELASVAQKTAEASDTRKYNPRQKFKYLEANSLNPLIIEILKSHVIKINSSSYGFDITDIDTGHIFENTTTNPTDWNVDLGKDDFTTTRKLVVLGFLSDVKDYEGGGLSILMNSSNAFYEKGTAIIFPAFHLYKFAPLIKGNQYIFVSWVCGPAFH